MKEVELAHLIALTTFEPFGSKRIARLRSFFSSYTDAFRASLDELSRVGIPKNIIDRFVEHRTTIQPGALLESTKKLNVQCISLDDNKYPSLLKEIYDPPALLYVRGTIADANPLACAVVGSRKASIYGKTVTKEVVAPLASSGIAIISGLAYGIDTIAHEACLEVGGTTWAVLASGVDAPSPSEQIRLAEEIISRGGALISEYPLGTQPRKHHFPVRNRIISGLSHATIVVEAGEKSGSLLTAKSALEQNRDVFAVPGPIHSPTSKGTNNLIKMGATPLTSAQDVLDVFSISGADVPKKKQTFNPDSKEEAVLLPHLSKSPMHIDELIQASELSVIDAQKTLTLMEMKGRVKHVGGNCFIIGEI